MHAGFGTQPAESVIAADAQRGGFSTGYFAFGLFDHFRFKAFRLGPAQVHTHQHTGPVLRFRTAGAGLNIDIAVRAVVFAGEHAAELQIGELFIQPVQLGNRFVEGFFVVRFYRQLQQAGNIFQPLAQLIQRFYYRFQRGTLFTQRLRAFRLVPDVRLFQLGVNFF